MREYLLYVKRGCGGRSWDTYVTPCFDADRLYWQERDGEQLYIVGKSRSLALVFALRAEIDQLLASHSAMQPPLEQIHHSTAACVQKVNRAYVRMVRDSGEDDAYTSAMVPDGQAVHWVSSSAQREDRPACTLPTPDLITADMAEQSADHLLPLLTGRALLWEEVEVLLRSRNHTPSVPLAVGLQWLVLRRQLEWVPAVRVRLVRHVLRHRCSWICERCGAGDADGSVRLAFCYSCQQGCAYCLRCLQMGRSRCCTPYIRAEQQMSEESNLPGRSLSRLQWSGRYSPLQEQAAEQARRFAARPPEEAKGGTAGFCPAFLIWAVCGAGKTELIFPAVDEMLKRGGRVLIATPRKDVVLELAPRLSAVFPSVNVIAVHGASEQKWEDAGITVATTHQVLRFYRRFDLVVVDEVDAFPYHGDPVLHRAVERAVSSRGKLLYLTATPPASLRRKLIPTKRCLAWLRPSQTALVSPTHVMVPQRYHGRPLPVPRIVFVSRLNEKLQAGQSIPPLLDTAARSLEMERQVFVFVPRIALINHVLGYLRTRLPHHRDLMAGVSASDPQREQKVRKFRERALRLLVTTTILERGVTIPRSDVIVLGADDPVFDEASLVQIAGRVGRSADDPDGTALFLLNRRSDAPCAARRQIRAMNRLAEEVAVTRRECQSSGGDKGILADVKRGAFNR
ncbi:MAG: DEAD/DEAH box helicase family protein [Brevibacillus sp.]|nr:DEAD/DEAH box helicase family protein [Brevibacillus sp.]